ncbi:MAG: AbrB/MazE/SpoVT family DNA-binding domain-containing protein [Actinobacteria bacterium]|nr:AbrB/MazE/SpoVT family DNA-binding domain-containing protein [Actinomycetota bacterium]
MSTTITSKGQVTIPKKIRDKFGLKSADRVTFKIEKNKVVLDFEKGTILDACRKQTKVSVNFRKQREQMKKAIAERIVKEMK